VDIVRNLDALKTQTRSNRQVIADAYQGIFEGDPDRSAVAFTDDSVWVHRDGNAISGNYRGAAEILAHTTNCWKMTDGTLRTEVLEILGGERFVVVIERLRAVRNGISLDTLINTVFEMTDGTVTTMRTLPTDVEVWNAFWA
jgi:ketosteroid isomerase-like protein